MKPLPRSKPQNKKKAFSDHSRRDSSSQSTQSDTTDILLLRKQLSSVAWVQCDNTGCLKWRKVKKEVADKLGEDDSWTCCMNADSNYNRCEVPEEDTAEYDRLAKKAKLGLIRSEIKPGSLVWAKMAGYCRWPGLVTMDPSYGDHMEIEDDEIEYYHVEFLGGERSHSWLRAVHVEVFGDGNKEIRDEDTQQTRKKGKCKRGKKLNCVTKAKLRKTYKGSNSVNAAVAEALKLLPLSSDQRLKTCWFVAEPEKSRTHGSYKDNKNGKKKKLSERVTCKAVFKPAEDNSSESGFSSQSTHQKKRQRKENKVTHKNIEVKAESQETKTLQGRPRKHSTESTVKTTAKLAKSSAKRGDDKKTGVSCSKPETKGLGCLNFPSSLIGSSKEERFILDVQMYQQNEKAFEEDVTSFMASQCLDLSAQPIWQDVKVSFFNIFLAVYERGGFELVCDNHLWSAVYAELIHHHHDSKGGIMVKKFYHRNLYAYELYVTGEDYTLIVRSLKQNPPAKSRKKKAPPCKIEEWKESGDMDEEIDVEGCDSLKADGSVFSDQMGALDEILLVLENQQVPDCQVPDVDHIPLATAPANKHGMVATATVEPREDRVDTASGIGQAMEPEANAQVVPELDFPSSVESSERSSHLEDLHEMQALQMDVGDLDLQIENM